jgi:hypothetical protein
MTYGVGRSKVNDEESAHYYGWVLGDTTCFWLHGNMQVALEEGGNRKIYVKGCEHAGFVVSGEKVFMEVECPRNCFYRR